MKKDVDVIKSLMRNMYFSRHPEICLSVAEWAVSKGLPIIDLAPPIISDLQHYVSGDRRAFEELQFHRAALMRSQVMVVIEKAIIRDSVGFVELPDGKICYEGNWFLPYIQKHPAYTRRSGITRRLKGDVYSLLCLWGEEFYHWFHDVLPRLEFALPHLPSGIKFLIQSTPRSYQLDSLRAYGIVESDLIYQPVSRFGVNSKIDRLWFATPAGHPGLGAISGIKKVAERLQNYYKVSSSRITKANIYISRRKAKCRKVLNEEELKISLQNHGFVIETCEDLTLSEQIKLFSDAEVIIGPHGAGLINMIYSKEGVSVTEITVNSAVSCYFVLAKQLHHDFSRLGAYSSNMQPDDDMTLSHDSLSHWLQSLSKKENPTNQ